jgi:hypothetical protein
LWADYTKAPVYVLDTSSINYIDEEAGQEQVLAIIDGWLDGKPHPDAPAVYQVESPDQLSLDFDVV